MIYMTDWFWGLPRFFWDHNSCLNYFVLFLKNSPRGETDLDIFNWAWPFSETKEVCGISQSLIQGFYNDLEYWRDVWTVRERGRRAWEKGKGGRSGESQKGEQNPVNDFLPFIYSTCIYYVFGARRHVSPGHNEMVKWLQNSYPHMVLRMGQVSE